jgi:hypothetical protein
MSLRHPRICWSDRRASPLVVMVRRLMCWQLPPRPGRRRVAPVCYIEARTTNREAGQTEAAPCSSAGGHGGYRLDKELEVLVGLGRRMRAGRLRSGTRPGGTERSAGLPAAPGGVG